MVRNVGLTRGLAIAASVAVALVSACASATVSPHPPGAVTSRLEYTDGEVMPDGCFVVSKDDVERITGHRVAAAQPFLSDSPGCTYLETGGLLLGTRFTRMSTQAPIYAAARAKAGTALVAGLGDEAIWIPSIRNLWIVKSDWMIAVCVGRIAGDDVRLDLSKQFANLVLPKFE